MAQVAVDIVLLPDEAMTNRAIEINRQLITSGRPELVLSREDHLPHISLAMGCIDEAEMPSIRKRLEDVARQTTVKALQIVGVTSSVNSRGETTCLLEVERTEGASDAPRAGHEGNGALLPLRRERDHDLR